MLQERSHHDSEGREQTMQELIRSEVRAAKAELRNEIKDELRAEMKLELEAEKERTCRAETRAEELAIELQRLMANTPIGADEELDTLAVPRTARAFEEEALLMTPLGDKVGPTSSGSRELELEPPAAAGEPMLGGMMVPADDVDLDYKDLTEDMWGIAVMLLTRDLCEISKGNAHKSHMVRLIYATVCYLVNIFLQIAILRWVAIYIVGNSVWTVQSQYAKFHKDTFDSDGNFQEHKWITWDGPRDELCDAVINKRLFLGCVLFLWIGRMLGEFKTIQRMYREIDSLPRAPHGAILQDCISFARGGREEVEILALPQGIRYAIYGGVLLPKVFVCLLLTTLGCQWLTATLSFSDLILNALALEFIIAIDENILEFFLPKRVVTRLGNTKLAYPITNDHSEAATEHAIILDYQRNIANFAVCVIVTILYVLYLQQVLPYHTFDIEEHCGAWYMNQFSPKCSPFESGCFPFGNVKPPHDYEEMQPA